MPNPIEEDDELAQAVGRVAGRWGMAEFEVESMFTWLLGAAHRQATIAFSFFKAVPTQVDIIELLLDENPKLTAEERATCKAALRSFKAMSPERNSIIHYPFGYDSKSASGKELYKLRVRRKGEQLHWAEPTSHKEVMKFADRISVLNEHLRQANTIVFEASHRKPPPPPLPPIPIPNVPKLGQ